MIHNSFMLTALMLSTTLAVTRLNPGASCCNPMAQFARDPQFISSHLPPLIISFKPQVGRDVDFPDASGKPTHGFYVPASKGSKGAIVMVHEWWGLNDQIRREAEHLHSQTGYAFLAVDLYEGKSTRDPQEAGRLMGSVDVVRCTAIVRSAVDSLKNGRFGPKAAKVGTIGYCFGGGWSYQTAVAGGKRVDACVMYYGMPDTSPPALAHLSAPVLMIWGKKDKWINADVVSKFEVAMKRVHKPLQTIGYNADHAFANPSNPHYDVQASLEANRETLKFWRRHLG